MLGPAETASRKQAAASESSATGRRGEPPQSLASALESLRGQVSTWSERALGGAGTRWLLEVPDIGPACEVLLADELFHDLNSEERDGLLAWIRASQTEAGAWCNGRGDPDLSLTAMGWWACVQAGEDPESDHLVRALRVVHSLGGAQRAHFSVRLWLAMAGAIPWSWLPAIPTELWLLPTSSPLSPGRISPWARGMLTPYLLIARAPTRLHLSDPSPLVLLRADGKPVSPRLTRPGLAGDLLQAFDRSVKLFRKLPRGPMLRVAVGRAQRWLDEAQQSHGGWFSTRPTVLGLLALRVMGAVSDDARIRRGLDHLRSARGYVKLPSGERGLAQALGATPMRAAARLLEATPDDDGLAWLLRQELSEPGAWQRRADAPAGGWPIEPGGRRHLDIEATCRALEALTQVEPNSQIAGPAWAARRRAIDVLLAMQEADGSFGRFERGEVDPPMRRLPWNDAALLASGDAADETHVRLTAEVLSRLGPMGFRMDDDRVGRAIEWSERRGEAGLGGLSTTTLSALARGLGTTCNENHPLRLETERQLRGRQLEDGSFGSVVETAQALRGLLGMGPPCVQMRRAARALVARDTTAEAASPCDGVGLSPQCHDVAAAPREALIALRAFAAAGGSLANGAA